MQDAELLQPVRRVVSRRFHRLVGRGPEILERLELLEAAEDVECGGEHGQCAEDRQPGSAALPWDGGNRAGEEHDSQRQGRLEVHRIAVGVDRDGTVEEEHGKESARQQPQVGAEASQGKAAAQHQGGEGDERRERGDRGLPVHRLADRIPEGRRRPVPGRRRESRG